jgi:hypothetical protein
VLGIRIPRRWLLLPLVLLLLLGWFEGAYGRSDYAGDAISYLDLSRAISSGQWKLAFSSLWGFGYPLLLCFTRILPLHSPAEEWQRIHALNLLILIATWFAGLFLLDAIFLYQEAGDSAPREDGRRRNVVLSLIVFNCIFLPVEIGMNRVSRISPDMLVVCLYLLTSGLTLKMIRQPSRKIGILLGLSLGFGYITKAIFLPLSLLQIALLAVALISKKHKPVLILAPVIAFLSLAVPYAGLMSWANGYLTTGEAGALNYGYFVNHMQHWANWQGGPTEAGAPLHPTRRLMNELPMFAFEGAPFAVTYSPQTNMPYWYHGYRHFFRWSYQRDALGRNIRLLVHMLRVNAIFPTTFIAAVCLFFLLTPRAMLRNLAAYWPVWMTASAMILSYLLIWADDRYVCGFLLCLALLLIAGSLSAGKPLSSRASKAIAVIMIAGCTIHLAVLTFTLARTAKQGQTRANDPQWIAGEWIAQHGFHHGEQVGAIANETNMWCTWAYISGLHIVAEVASGDHNDYDLGHDVEEFWNAPSDVRARSLSLFQSSGAAAVFSIGKPASVTPEPGWIQIPRTNVWVYRFGQS